MFCASKSFVPATSSVSSINIFFIVHIVQNKALIYSTGNKTDLAVENYQRALEIDKKMSLST